ncbi:GNAT family N-acetyltransferase [Candidatus Parcubacteria bacterium]|jgi:ribosomal protein S18 acetylase RimI-like enzyme|nr:GNAT family N-acetyltransferase [Candidatus Parcubacteria bacterium]
MKNNFEIRKANIKDLEHILRLYHELLKEEFKKFDKSLNPNWAYSKLTKKYFQERITKKNGFIEVVENNKKIIGYLCGGISEQSFYLYRQKAKYARLDEMLIDKKFRGKNLGTKLVKDFVKWCEKNKVDYISVTASVGNKKSLNFYRKLGFKDYDLTLEMKMKK